MGVLAAIVVINILSNHGQALYSGFPWLGPISPYLGSIPVVTDPSPSPITFSNVTVGGYSDNLNNQRYGNGYFWPPTLALVSTVIQNKLLQLYGFSGLGFRGLDKNRFDLGSLDLGLPLIGGFQAVQIPFLSSPFGSQHCRAPCFVCLPQPSSTSCFLTMQQQRIPAQIQCCCCIRVDK